MSGTFNRGRKRSQPGKQVPDPDSGITCQADPKFLEHARREELGELASLTKIRSFTDRLESHFDRSVAMAQDDARAIEGLKSFGGRDCLVCEVPRMPDDIYDFDGLLAIDEHLFGRIEGA